MINYSGNPLILRYLKYKEFEKRNFNRSNNIYTNLFKLINSPILRELKTYVIAHTQKVFN